MAFMALSAVCYALMSFLIKVLYLHSKISPYEIAYWQGLMTTIILLVIIRIMKVDFLFIP